MKTMIKKAGYFLAMFALAACEPFDFEQEMGQKVICIISDNDLVYTGMHDLNQSESTGYISINCGGSLQIDRDVDVTLEYAPEVLQSYNKIKYDIDQSKYAKELPSKYYSIAQMGVTLKAGRTITGFDLPDPIAYQKCISLFCQSGQVTSTLSGTNEKSLCPNRRSDYLQCCRKTTERRGIRT